MARLLELQSRLSPVRSALSLQNSRLEPYVEGMHVQGSSPRVVSASVPSTSVLPLRPPLPSHLFSVGEISIGSPCSSADSASIDAALSRAYTIDVGLESSDQPQGSSEGTLAAPASPREPPAEAADSERLASGVIVVDESNADASFTPPSRFSIPSPVVDGSPSDHGACTRASSILHVYHGARTRDDSFTDILMRDMFVSVPQA